MSGNADFGLAHPLAPGLGLGALLDLGFGFGVPLARGMASDPRTGGFKIIFHVLVIEHALDS